MEKVLRMLQRRVKGELRERKEKRENKGQNQTFSLNAFQLILEIGSLTEW